MSLPDDFDWRKSRPHLFLLSRFDEGLQKGYIPYFREYWISALGELPEISLERFIRDGVVESLPLDRKLAFKFRIVDLKAILRQKGLKLTGTKPQLISRLVDSNKAEMEEIVGSLIVYGCTKAGLEITKQYIEFCKQELEEALRAIFDMLKVKNFAAASEIAFQYKNNQDKVAHRYAQTITKDYPCYEEQLRLIFNTTPLIYKNLCEVDLEILRIGAAFLFLEFIPPSFIYPPTFSPDIRIKNHIWASRAILCALNFKNELSALKKQRADFFEFQEAFGKDPDYGEIIENSNSCEFIYIQTVNDTYVCPECKRLSKKKFRLEEVPELPYERCTCEYGCRCSITSLPPSEQ